MVTLGTASVGDESFSGEQCPLPPAWVEFFLSVVFVYSLCFSSYNLPLYYSIFTGISVDL
jgi:hypothetical protein